MKTTTASADPKAFHHLQELVRQIDVAMMTTVTPDGTLRSRPMVTREFDDGGLLWFFTADDSGKVQDLEGEHAVNVTYSDPKKQQYVSITGSASLVRDRARAEELWDAKLKAYFPKGLDQPHLALLCVRIEFAEVWDSPSGVVQRLLGKQRDKADTHTKVDIRATPASG